MNAAPPCRRDWRRPKPVFFGVPGCGFSWSGLLQIAALGLGEQEGDEPGKE